MRFITAVLTVVALVPLALTSPAPTVKVVLKFSGQTSGKYIVKLKDGVAKAKVFKQLKNADITHDWKLIHGFAAHLDAEAVDVLRTSADVEYIAEDGIFHTQAIVTQTNAPWGLSRLSQAAKLSNQDPNALTFSYRYDSAAGAGVDIYIVDTGIYTAHSQFGGRARWGATFGGYANADGNGHGTHVAGTAAGSQYGVAKAASLIAVKALSDAGTGSVSDVVDGLNFVAVSAAASGRPSIASLSFAGGVSIALDSAVTALVELGIHVVVAAGNSNADASRSSPARAPAVITVGASTIADARASFSNYGSVVDVFAPGENVISSWIGSTTASKTLSGTSMATPHVAGLVAYFISKSKNGNTTPAAISDLIKALSVKGVLAGIPSGTNNDLVQNAVHLN